jgi:heavy metal efflux system protein
LVSKSTARVTLRFILKRRFLLLIVSILFCFAGIWSWNRLEFEAYPDIGDTEVSIVTKLSSISVEDMEMQITIPIEKIMNTVPGVVSSRSRTIFGLSIVSLIFEEKMDIYLARQMVSEKLAALELPPGSDPQISPMTSSVGEIFRYVIEGDDVIPLSTLREIQEYIVVPRLLVAYGVADVVNFGGHIRQYQVVLNPIQLEKYDISVEEIAEAIQKNNRNAGGNFLVLGISRINIRGIGRIAKLEDIENIVVRNRGGVPILIKDIASVETGIKPQLGILSYFDKNRNKIVLSGVEGIILLRKFENPRRTIAAINEVIQELNTSILPKGIKIHPFYDRSELIKRTINNVFRNLVFGTIIIFIFFGFILGTWRGAFIGTLSIPFVVLFTFFCIHVTKTPAVLLSLGSIDFGIIADAATVTLATYVRQYENLMKPELPSLRYSTIVQSYYQSRGKIIFTLSILLIGLAPILALDKVEGKFFIPLVKTFFFAIAGSMFYSIVILPILIFIFMRKQIPIKENPILEKLQEKYSEALWKIIQAPKKFLIICLILLMTGSLSFVLLGSEFLPEIDEGCLWMRIYLPSGVSLDESKKYSEIVLKQLSNYPEISGVLTQLGQNDDGTDPFGPNHIEALVQLNPRSFINFGGDRSKKELTEEIKNVLKFYLPGAAFLITQPILDNTTEVATGTSANLAVLITGDSLYELRNISRQILLLVKSISGASETSMEQVDQEQTQLLVEIDRDAASRYGVNVSGINHILETAIGGMPVSYLYENEKKFEIVVRFTQESRSTPDSIGKIMVISQSGQKIPLSMVAKIYLKDGDSILFRDSGKRQMIVKTNIRGRDNGSFANELQDKIQSEVFVPKDISLKLGGEFQNLDRARKSMAILIPLVIVLIYVSLLILFHYNNKYVIVVMSNIPIALSGGSIALYIRGMNLNISSIAGFISLIGISIMSALLLVGYLEKKRKGGMPLEITIRFGAVTLFKPRILVNGIAILGFIPAALSTGVGTDFQRPLATVIVGGLSLSVGFTIFLTPLLFYLAEKKDSIFNIQKIFKSYGKKKVLT